MKISAPKMTGKIKKFVSKAFEKFKSRIYSKALDNPHPIHSISKKKTKRHGILMSISVNQLIIIALNS